MEEELVALIAEARAWLRDKADRRYRHFLLLLDTGDASTARDMCVDRVSWARSLSEGHVMESSPGVYRLSSAGHDFLYSPPTVVDELKEAVS